MKKANKWSYMVPIGNEEMKDMRGLIPGFLEVPNQDYESLSSKYKWFEERYKDYKGLRVKLFALCLIQGVEGLINPIKSIEDFKEITEKVGSIEVGGGANSKPTIESQGFDSWIDRWKEDAEFGRQTLNGLNPVAIKRIKKIPENFPVADETIQGHLKQGVNLEEELAQGRIYMVDFDILEGIPTGEMEGKKLELAAAMALFYHDHEDNLRPVAIQLGNPICALSVHWKMI